MPFRRLSSIYVEQGMVRFRMLIARTRGLTDNTGNP